MRYIVLENWNAHPSTLAVINHVHLNYAVAWPISAVIPPTILVQYGCCHRFLLYIHLARAQIRSCLAKARGQRRHQQNYSISYVYRYCAQLTQFLNIFMETLCGMVCCVPVAVRAIKSKSAHMMNVHTGD